MTTPRSTSKIYDTITIGGVESPGICTVTSPVFRKTEFDIQGRPGFIGKVAVPKGQEIVRRAYRFTIWDDAHFAQWEIMQTRLEKARRARPRPEYLEVVDPRLKGMSLTRFLVEGWSEEIEVEKGKWARDVLLIEHTKLVPTARLPANKAVQDEFKAEAEKATAERVKAEAQFKEDLAKFKVEAGPAADSFLKGFL